MHIHMHIHMHMHMHMHVSMYTHAYNDDERTMTMTNDSVCLPLPRGEDAHTGISYATRTAYAVFQLRLIDVVLTAEFLISAVSRQPLRRGLRVSVLCPCCARQVQTRNPGEWWDLFKDK